ncbi:MAG: RluA family pseudouridine synthase, partial [Bacteroidota bacterium]
MKYDWSILQETTHWLAINKPSSLNVEPIWDYPNVQDQVIDYLRQATGRQSPYVGIVHRLDRPVSG